MTKNYYIYLLPAFIAVSAMAQVPAPAPPQQEPIALVNGMVHLGNGQVLENGTVAFEQGKITFAGKASDAQLTGYRQIDVGGKHVYPGLILPLTNVGLVEIEAVRATEDYSETGNLKPHVRSAIAFNTDSELLPTLKFTGIQLVQAAPRGGRVEGTSSIMQLDAWNWEDALYREDDGVHINWPSLSFAPRWWMGETGRRDNPDYRDQVNEIVRLIRDAKSYMEISPATQNLALEAMIPVITGKKRLYVYSNRPAEIVEAIQTLKKLEIPHLVLTGGEDVWYVKDLVKEHQIPVLLENVHRRPNREGEDVDLPYKLPAMLHAEGILVGLTHSSGMVASSRNLPFFAGTAAAYGLDKETALKMVTSNTARILGIDDKTGTLEQGKDANVVVSNGDLLDMRTNEVVYSFIQGREVTLEALQQRLYDKYREKYQNDQ